MDYREARELLLANSVEQPAPYGLEKPCRVWIGPRIPKGYSYTHDQGRSWSVHRLSFSAFNERQITEGAWILHWCDNPPCIEPSHLHEGDAQINVDEMWERGRGLIGEDHHSAVLSDNEVGEIKLLGVENKKGAVEVAKQYNVTHGTIYHIWNCLTRQNIMPELTERLLECRGRRRPLMHQEDQIIKVRTLYNQGVALKEIANEVELSDHAVRRILYSGHWQDIGPEIVLRMQYSDNHDAVATLMDQGLRPYEIGEKLALPSSTVHGIINRVRDRRNQQ
jgi:hypothetical protein